MSYPEHDTEYTEYVLDKVERYSDESGWSLGFDSYGFGFRDNDNESGVVPKVGDTMRQYGRGFGHAVRGLFINGQKVYYRTAEEDQAHFQRQQAKRDRESIAKWEKGRVEADARIAALPSVFRERIEAFQQKDNWRWRYEGYELFTCEEAVKIAAHFKSRAEIAAWAELTYEEQQRVFPLSDEHSGNTAGQARMLAALYLERPELILQMHGAMCPLVGCEDYGCYAAREKVPA